MALTGDAIDAREALRVGLVSSVHRPDELQAAANSIAATIAANAPLAVPAVKETMVRGQNSPFDAALAAGGPSAAGPRLDLRPFVSYRTSSLW